MPRGYPSGRVPVTLTLVMFPESLSRRIVVAVHPGVFPTGAGSECDVPTGLPRLIKVYVIAPHASRGDAIATTARVSRLTRHRNRMRSRVRAHSRVALYRRPS